MKTAFQNSEAQLASEVMLNLNRALKSIAFFPQHHENIINSLAMFEKMLNVFLHKQGCLHIQIAKGQLLYEEVLIQERTENENAISFLFARDGIEWFEFSQGITLVEVNIILRIINDYRVLNDESDENIATALWQYEFPHFNYETVDIPISDSSLLDFSKFNVSPEPVISGYASRESKVLLDKITKVTDNTKADGAYEIMNAEQPVSIDEVTHTSEPYSLTDEERHEVHLMVINEERQDDTDSVLEILLISLLTQENKYESTIILDFIYDRYLHTLSHGNFDLSFKILKNLKRIFGKQSGNQKWLPILKGKKWMLGLIDDFFNNVSQETPFEHIIQFFHKRYHNARDYKQIRYLAPTLRLLKAKSIPPLLNLIENIEYADIRRELFSVVFHLGRIKPQQLKAICENKFIAESLPFICQLDKDTAADFLIQITLHSSPDVQLKSLDKLLNIEHQKDDIIPRLILLLESSDLKLRKMFLSYLGSARDPKVELLLHNYLRKKDYSFEDKSHILACYAALGQCGSNRSIPFLKRVLLERNWSKVFNQSELTHKEGAAIALHHLALDEAKKILKEGSESIMPSIRSICRKNT